MFLTKKTPLQMPLNLVEWVTPDTLGGWVREVVDSLDATQAFIKEAFDKPPECRLQTMLALLAFAYCVQVFRSKEIAAACHSEPVFRELCGDHPPFPHELEHFRRTHRHVLQNVIAQVMLRAVKLHFNYSGDLPPGLERNIEFRAEERTDIARHMSAWDD